MTGGADDPSGVRELAAMAQRAAARLTDSVRAAACGQVANVSDVADELQRELTSAYPQLTDEENAGMWAQYCAHIRKHDPETYRLLFGFVTALCVLHSNRAER